MLIVYNNEVLEVQVSYLEENNSLQHIGITPIYQKVHRIKNSELVLKDYEVRHLTLNDLKIPLLS